MKQITVRIADLEPHPANYNEHDDDQIGDLVASLDRFNQYKNIVTWRGYILAGHGLVEAAKRLGWEEIVVEDRPDLSEADALALIAADNEIARKARADAVKLLDLVSQVMAAGSTVPGIGEEELARILGDAHAAQRAMRPPAEDPGDQTERAEELLKKWGTAPGQLWEIPSQTVPGRAHRLLCGDSTRVADVERLMNGERAALFATDPPYLVDYDGTNHPHKWGEAPRLSQNKDWSEEYKDWDRANQGEGLYDDFIRVALQVALIENAAWYCWHASKRQVMLEQIWEKHGAFVHQQIIWAKDRPVLTRSWYMWQHEPCFFGWVRGKKPRRIADDYPATVWHLPTIAPGTSADRPTSKPVELFAIPLRQHTLPGELCYEPFSGSGSQQVAAEQEGRVCYGLEIAPPFVAAILERLAGMSLAPRLLEG